jgi:hypothetical protein
MPLRPFAAFFVSICFVLSASAQNGNSSSSNGSSSSTPAPAPTPDAVASAKAKAASAAAATVEQSLTSYSALVLNAARYQKAITDITGSTSARPQAPIEDLRTIQATIVAIQQTDVLNGISNAVAALTKDDGDRDTKCSALPLDSTQQDVLDAQKACSQAKSDAAAQSKALSDQLASLKAALQTVYSYVANQIGAYLPKLDPAAAMTNTADATELLQKVAPALVAMRGVLANYGEYQATWNSLQSTLKGLGIDPPGPDATGKTPPTPDAQLTAVKTKINSVLPNLVTWFGTLNSNLVASAGALDGKLTGVGTDPAKNNRDALQAISDRASDLASAESIVSAWPPLVGFLTDGDPAGFSLKDAKKGFDDVRRATENLRTSSARLQDAIAGDASNFETAQVSLYYFFNVQQLMEALNGNVRSVGGVAEAQQAAAEQRKSLTAAELDLADAQATVNKFQKQVLDLQEQQRQLRQKLSAQNSSLGKLSNKLQNAVTDKQRADTDLEAAQQSTDADKSGAVDRAKAKQTQAAGKVSQSQSDVDSAKADRDNTQAQLDGSQNQSDSLPAKISAAQQALSESQTAVSQQRRRMIQTAQAESDAFAFARDNTPYLYAQADASSTDPVKRVFLYAYPDSKIITIRGKIDDINEVRHIISVFDKPAPQARLSLWTFELSATSEQKTNKRAAENLNKSMEIVDEHLSDARALENTTLTLLRDLINEEVRYFSSLDQQTAACQCSGADLEKLRRLNFYDPLVLTQLKFSVTDPNFKHMLHELVPDPAGSTTLGEALLILSLARPHTRAEVRQFFENQIKPRLNDLVLPSNIWPLKRPPRTLLPRTWHALGVWEDETISFQGGLTSTQLEITRALRTSYDTRVVQNALNRLKYLSESRLRILRSLDQLNAQVREIEERAKAKLSDPQRQELQALLAKSNPTETEAGRRDQLLLQAVNQLGKADADAYRQRNLNQTKIQSSLSTVQQQSAKVAVVLGRYGPVTDLSMVSEDTQAQAQELRRWALSLPSLNTASPRVAAADEMLKSLTIALEDDLSDVFIQPMINSLRIKLTSAHVNVGIIQRESMLATNRGKARIDPKASAQLAVGTEEDILTGVQQLAQLYAVVQSGGALGVIGALQQQPREPAPEIYALTTGNKFEVTPVFDPSGQALRFKFDFVNTTNLQEPNGSTSPQLPRIERHTINTEVQLSNLETREISRYESNARLGRPTEYSGGVPILKDIPYVRPWVPLIGWFVRKAGANAVAQQSVIFGQTTIYPTIGALIDLVTDQTQESDDGDSTETVNQPVKK